MVFQKDVKCASCGAVAFHSAPLSSKEAGLCGSTGGGCVGPVRPPVSPPLLGSGLGWGVFRWLFHPLAEWCSASRVVSTVLFFARLAFRL